MRHEQLKEILVGMGKLLDGRTEECRDLRQTGEYILELEAMHWGYERLLDELSRQITAYEALYSEIRVQFLGKKLKKLKKTIPVEKSAFLELQANIRLVYGT